ncbi:MAG: SurA N-terminal domain-containing protein [Myxococcota bacterium]|nr:SurA N-terminal domain-containing protein [Myxococcota bacterium]
MHRLFIASLLFSTSALAGVVERVAAVVNDEVIALSEIYEVGGDYIEQALTERSGEEVRRRAELEVLEELVSQELMVQEMLRLGIDVVASDVDQALDDIASRNGVDRERLKGEVERAGMVWASYREGIKQELRQMKFDQVILQPRVSTSDDEIEALYRSKVDSAESGRVLDGIFLPWSEAASLEDPQAYLDRLEGARTKLAEGIDWAQVVLDFPESPYASRGGRMSSYQRGELVDQLETAAWALGLGEVSQPLVTEGGAFLLRYAEEAPAQVPPMESILPQLQGELMMAKIESEREVWLVQARRKASVEIKLESP